jgi:hypothetical protein
MYDVKVAKHSGTKKKKKEDLKEKLMSLKQSVRTKVSGTYMEK